jgi:hypothetical protein
MPGTIYDDTLTDSGSAALGGSRVYFVAWEVKDFGPVARHPSFWDTDQYVGIGHWELGNDVTPGGILSGIAYDAPHWINRELGQWIAPPGQVGSDFSSAIAQYISWTLSPGVEVHLYVFGDV